MIELKWDDIRSEFEWDGSLRDIYVLDANLADWQRVIEFLQMSGYEYKFFRHGVVTPLPSDITIVFKQKESSACLLTIDLNGIQVNSHFFFDGEIEFDIDPREITGQGQLEALIRFLQSVAESVNKPVILTPENLSEKRILKMVPGTNKIEYLSV